MKPNEETFFAFLQERWPIFIDYLGKTDQIKEKPSEYGLKYNGQVLLPFSD